MKLHIIAVVITLLCFCRIAPGAKLKRFEFKQRHMGTLFKIKFYTSDENIAQKAALAAFARVKELNDILTNYDANSELMRLSLASKKPQRTSHDLFEFLQRAAEISHLTGGAFDITIGPLVKLWKQSVKEKKLPLKSQIKRAQSSVDYEAIKLSSRRQTVFLEKSNMELDPGGIGKGYALDEAMKVLTTYKINRAIIIGGGDVLASHPPPGKKGWKVGLVSLNSPWKPQQYLYLKEGATSTSGDTEQFVTIAGKRYSHIVDPKTGLGLSQRKMVTTTAPNSTLADSLGTALSVMDTRKALELIKSIKYVSCRIMEFDNGKLQTYSSKNFPALKSVKSKNHP